MSSNYYKDVIEHINQVTKEMYSITEHKSCLDIEFEDKTITLLPVINYIEFQSENIVKKNSVIVYEDLWISKPEVIKSRLFSFLNNTKRVFARKTTIRKLTKDESNNFLLTNHLHPPISGKFRYGVFYKEELLASIVFSRVRLYPRANEQTLKSYEIIRHCNKNGYTIVGGLSKLIKHFIKVREVNHLATYVEQDWTNGIAYEKIGFKKAEESLKLKVLLNPKNMERKVLKHDMETITENDPPFLLIKHTESIKYETYIKA